MKYRRIVFGTIFCFLLIIVSVLALNVQSIRSDPKAWIVDDNGYADFDTIQEAVNAANSGDIIFVHTGTYKLASQIIIDKSLTLIGENNTNTIIDGTDSWSPIMRVEADEVTIKDLTFKTCKVHYDPNGVFAGVLITSDQCLVESNIFPSGDFGVFLGDASSNVIRNNVFFNCIYGIASVDYSDSRMRVNFNFIGYNNISFCEYGIWKLGGGQNNTIVKNIVTNCSLGILIHFGLNDVVFQNEFSKCGTGIALEFSDNVDVRANRILYNKEGISIKTDRPVKNSVCLNNFVNNTAQMYFPYGSDLPMIVYGSYPSGGNYWSDYSGVDLYKEVFQNVTGSDGIGDMPHIINENNTDRYSLMKPYIQMIGDINFDRKVDAEDISAFVSGFNSFPSSLEWNPYVDFNFDAILDIFDAIILANNYVRIEI
jgi:parallel beta-helix repeat protein